MRRLLVALILFMFGASFAGLNGRSVAAQNSPDEVARALEACPPSPPQTEEWHAQNPDAPWFPWEGTCQPIAETEAARIPFPVDPQNRDAPARTMQPYAVAFKEPNSNTAVIGADPRERELGLVAEFMVIYVREGTFAVQPERNGGRVVVSTVNEEIPTLTVWDKSAALAHKTPYQLAGAPLEVNGEKCTRSCPVTHDQPVALYPGDIAIAEEGALCLYCLVGNGQIGDALGRFQEDSVKGLIEVYALLPGSDPNDFSWIRSWEIHQQRTQSRNEDAKPGMMAWAYNPGSGCK